jgi:hypothetical protein
MKNKLWAVLLMVVSVGVAAQTFPVNNLNVTGQLQLSGSPGTAGQIPQSNGTSPPSWVTGITPGDVNPALNYLSSLTGAVSRTYTSKFSDWTSVKDFGATGNGSTDDSAALLAAATAGSVIVPPGNYVIGSSISLPNAVQVLPGAVFQIASGQTLTFNNQLIAGVGQIFSGTGNVLVNSQFTTTGYAEWWGAVTNNIAVDNSTYINSCIVAMVVCQLQAGNYYTNGTILQQTNSRAVVGALSDLPGTNGSTFITNQSTSNTIYQIGPNTYTGTLQNTNILKNVFLQRSVAPLKTSQSNGLLVQFTVWTSVSGVQSQDSGIGYKIAGDANIFFDKDFALRSLAGTGSGTDQFYGFWLDAATNIGGAGGSESVYITNCGTSSTVTWSSSIDYQGFVATGAFGYSDLFLINFTTANTGYGIDLVGNGNTSPTLDVQNEDVQIINPILDSCQIVCVNFSNTSLYGSIQIVAGYLDLGSTAIGPIGINYINSNGSITVLGTEILCSQSGSGKGVVATNSRSISQIGNKYLECNGTPLTVSGTTNSRFEDQIRAFGRGVTNQPAIQVASSSNRNIFKMSVDGASSAYSQGYFISDGTTGFSEYDATGLNAGAITNVSKILNNGTGVATVGAFGTSNYAFGVMN